MDNILSIDGFASRLTEYADRREFPSGSAALLRAVMMRGRVARSEVPTLIGMSPHVADVVVRELADDGILDAVDAGHALELRFPSNTHKILFPGLCAEV